MIFFKKEEYFYRKKIYYFTFSQFGQKKKMHPTKKVCCGLGLKLSDKAPTNAPSIGNLS